MDPWIHGSMDPWIHGSAAGAAAGAASAATVCTYYIIIGGALQATPCLHDEVHTVAAEAAALAAAPAAPGTIWQFLGKSSAPCSSAPSSFF